MESILKGLAVIFLMCLIISLMRIFKTFAAIVIITGLMLGALYVVYYIGDSFGK